MPKPKYTAQEQRAQREERRKVIYLRMAIWQELDARSITTPADIGAALGMPAPEAVKLLTRRRQRSFVAALEAVAARLEAQVPARGTLDVTLSTSTLCSDDGWPHAGRRLSLMAASHLSWHLTSG
jgi:hypothetical protein